MFLSNYAPRNKKIKQRKYYIIIKYCGIFLFFLIILATIYISSSNTNKFLFEEQFYEDKYLNNKNSLKIENAKLIGNDKKNRPYMITAESAIKNNIKKNIMLLYSVEADIALKNGGWLILNTKHASYNIENKILSTGKKVEMYYDNGTILETSNLSFNVISGIGNGDNGVKMYGSWGMIESGSFSFDTINHKFLFNNKPTLLIN
ncbi:MAG: hypothetical protein CMP40_02350 [Rickettsiales bacterium]|nr:hypothetical protein [Rickettsiales bacterium]